MRNPPWSRTCWLEQFLYLSGPTQQLIKPMDPSVEKSLQQKTDQELFQLMKYSTPCDFEHKILAGCILHERQTFDRLKMANEKKELIDGMHKLVASYDNPVRATRKVRRRALAPVLLCFLFIALFTGAELHELQQIPAKPFDWMGLAAFLLLGLLVMAYELATLSRKTQKSARLEQDHRALMLIRIAEVEQKWNF